MEKTFTMTKRICAASDGYQFLTSGYPNRYRDKATFDSVDGIFAKRPLLKDLKPNEYDQTRDGKPLPNQGIEVDFTISRAPRKGSRKMWVFGFLGRSRLITQYKPKDVRRGNDSTIAKTKLGSIYVDNWCRKDYFPDMPEGAVFPIYVTVTRKPKTEQNE